jgi:hypothetical protein
LRSPGKYHELVPRTVPENLLFRRDLIRFARRGGAWEKALWRMCREDVLFWIDAYVWQFNPKSVGTASLELGPFVTWDYQRAAVRKVLDCIDRKRDLVIEKSRDMGASWLCLLVMAWGMLFHGSKKFLCVSRNEKAVDDRDPDSLFWKLDFLFGFNGQTGWLPRWMVPPLERTELYFGNPTNGSYITGQAPTKAAGVGGRATAVFLDEFSQLREAQEILDRTSDTSGCRIFNGTHLGTGTTFYELTNPDSVAGSYVEKLRMHWTDHPDKVKGAYRYDGDKGKVVVFDKGYRYAPDHEFVTDGTPAGGPHPGVRSPWYDGECKRKSSSRAVAMDLDIDPAGSAGTLFDPLMVKQLVSRHARKHRWEGDIVPDPEDDERVVLVKRDGGFLRLWLTLDCGRPPPDRYAIGVDNSQGTGATPSCASVLNSIGQKVGEYANPTTSGEPTVMARLFVPLCKLFRDRDGQGAWLVWEVPGPGVTFGKHVIDAGYRRVFLRGGEGKFAKGPGDRPGWNNSPEQKDSLLVAYRDALREGTFVNFSERALRDTLNFQYRKDGHIEHAGVASIKDFSGARQNHGDLVMADAMAWKMLVTSGGVETEPPDPEAAETRPDTLAGRMRAAHNAASRDSWCVE